MKFVLECLGYCIDVEGFYLVGVKVKVIKEVLSLINFIELKFFLGMFNFYGKFMFDLVIMFELLYELLRKDICWNWGME